MAIKSIQNAISILEDSKTRLTWKDFQAPEFLKQLQTALTNYRRDKSNFTIEIDAIPILGEYSEINDPKVQTVEAKKYFNLILHFLTDTKDSPQNAISKESRFDENDSDPDKDIEVVKVLQGVVKYFKDDIEPEGDEEDEDGKETPQTESSASTDSPAAALPTAGGRTTAEQTADQADGGQVDPNQQLPTDAPRQTPTDQFVDSKLRLSSRDLQFELYAIERSLLATYGLDKLGVDSLPPQLRVLISEQLTEDFEKFNFAQYIDKDGKLIPTARYKLYRSVMQNVYKRGGFSALAQQFQVEVAKEHNDQKTQELEKTLAEKHTTVSINTVIKNAEEQDPEQLKANFYAAKDAAFKDQMLQIATGGVLNSELIDIGSQIINGIPRGTSLADLDDYSLRQLIPPDRVGQLALLPVLEQQKFLNAIRDYAKGIASVNLDASSIKQLQANAQRSSNDILQEIFRNNSLDGVNETQLRNLLQAYALNGGNLDQLKNLSDIRKVLNISDSAFAALSQRDQLAINNLQENLLKVLDFDQIDNFEDYIAQQRKELGNDFNHSNPDLTDQELAAITASNMELLKNGYTIEQIAQAYSDQELDTLSVADQANVATLRAGLQQSGYRPDYYPNDTQDIDDQPLAQAPAWLNNANHFSTNKKRGLAQQQLSGLTRKIGSFSAKTALRGAIVPGVAGLTVGSMVGALLKGATQVVAVGGSALAGAGVGALIGGLPGAAVGFVMGGIGGLIGHGLATGSEGMAAAANSVGSVATSTAANVGHEAAKIANSATPVAQNFTPGGESFFNTSAASFSQVAGISVGGTMITVGVVSAVSMSAVLLAFLPDVDTTFVGSFSTDIVESKYMKVEKIPSIREADAPSKITYTVRITKKTDPLDTTIGNAQIVITDITDTPSANKKEGTPPTPQLPVDFPTLIQPFIGTELTTTPIEFQFTIDTDKPEYQDSLVKNDIKVSFTADAVSEDANARAQTCFGDCPKGIVPACWPAKGVISQPPYAISLNPLIKTPYCIANPGHSHCDGKDSYKADAYDIADKSPNTITVYAVADGTVLEASDGWNDGYGTFIKIDHNNYVSIYAHLQSINENVLSNPSVNGGDPIGIMGSTGNSSGKHLHYEIKPTQYVLAEILGVDTSGLPTGITCDEFYQ